MGAAFAAAELAFTGVAGSSSAGAGRESIYSLAVDPESPATVYAGSYGSPPVYGTVYKSTDGGRSWRSMQAGLEGNPIMALAIDPRVPSTLYAGTERNLIPTAAGVFKSVDGGRTWRAANRGLAGNSVDALAIDPQEPTTLYAGANRDGFTVRKGGVFKTTNGGRTWKAVNAGLVGNQDVEALAIDPHKPATLYVTSWGEIFKTTNGGRLWRAVNAGLSGSLVYALALDPKNPATLYAGGESLFKSTDGGRAWRAVTTGLGRFKGVQALAIDPRRAETIYVGTHYDDRIVSHSRVFKSTNGGRSWRAANAGLPKDTSVEAFAIDPVTPTTVYAGTHGDGVFKSTNGGRRWRSTG